MGIVMKQRKKRTRIIAWAILIVFLLVVLTVTFFSGTAKAEEIDLPGTVIDTYTGFVDGVERTLTLRKSTANVITPYLEIGDGGPFYAYSGDDIVIAGLDKYGTVQVLCTDNVPYWWSYDLNPDFTQRVYNVVPNSNDPEGYMHDIVSFDFVGTGDNKIIVGYKTTSGETLPLPSFSEMKEVAGSDSPIEPSYIPKGGTPVPPTASPIIPNPESPSVETSEPPTVVPPTQTPSVSESPILTTPIPAPSTSTSVPIISTDPPSVTVQPTVTPKVSKKLDIKTSKKKGKITCSLREGNKTVIQYALKKGNLTWKVGKKKGSAKGVKYAGFIKKSRNLYYGDKKGRVYTISSKNGKKKLIIKKGAKKPIYSGKFVAKVKTASGSINISNK